MTLISTIYAVFVVAGWLWLTFEAFEYLAGAER